jgi:hypothetical protein
MLHAFIFDRLAIVVRHWYEVCEDDEEHGTRIEILKRVRPPQRGSASTSQPIELEGLVWRVDLFDLIGDEPGTMARAHHHVRFEPDGNTPDDRDWDPGLSADPFGWTEQRLADLPSLLEEVGLELDDLELEAEDVRDSLPAIMAAARECGPEHCVSTQQCLRATRDIVETVEQMTRQCRGDRRDPRTIGRVRE